MGIIWSIFSNFQLEGDENDNESPRVLEQYAAQVLGNKGHTNNQVSTQKCTKKAFHSKILNALW